MKELRMRVDVIVQLVDDVLADAETTVALAQALEPLRALVIQRDGACEVDMRAVSTRTRPRAPDALELSAAAALLDDDATRASDHPILGDAPQMHGVSSETRQAIAGDDLLRIPPELDRRVPRRNNGGSQ